MVECIGKWTGARCVEIGCSLGDWAAAERAAFVAWEAGVCGEGPEVDAAGDGAGGVVPEFAREERGLEGAHAVVAEECDLGVRIERVELVGEPLGELVEWDVGRTLDVDEAPLGLGAAVDQHERRVGGA